MQFRTAVKESASSSRIVALDIMRGYLILVIASVHLAYYPSLFGMWDGRGQLWVSEAEGFFFISGLLIGLIRRRDVERSGFKVAAIKVLKRGWRLYSAGIVLAFAYLIIGRALNGIAPGGIKLGLDLSTGWLGITWNILTLRYSYGWSDFLIYYAAFLFVSPAVIYILRRGWWYVVVALSLFVWYWRWRGSFDPYNSFLQWQVYFFLGSVIGYHWQQILTWFNGLSQGLLRWLQSAVLVLSAASLLASIGAVFGPQSSGWTGHVAQNEFINAMMTDGRIGLLRPVMLLLYFVSVYLIVRHYEKVIVKSLGWLLLPFGRNSLYVYILDSAILFTIPFFIHSSGLVVNSIIELLMIVAVWLAVRYRFLFRIIPR
jgi:hypothetical protein